MQQNNKWKRIGSGILAVCLVVTLLLSNGSFGVFAREDDTEDIQVQENQEETPKDIPDQTEEDNADSLYADGNDLNEEPSNPDEIDNNEETVTEEIKEDEEQNVYEQNAIDSLADQNNETPVLNTEWTVKNEDGIIAVSGTGTHPDSISMSRLSSEQRAKYTGTKTVVFGYNIFSETAIIGPITISITDCGIMSDDQSLEIWKVTDTGVEQVETNQIVVSEGNVSFTANGLGEYIAVSNVTTVDLAKGNIIVTEEKLQGTQQDGTEISVPFLNEEGKKYRISQSNQVTRCENTIEFSTGKNYTSERTMILDGINTSKDIKIPARNHTVILKLLLRNLNQVHRLYYGTGDKEIKTANRDSKLTIDDYGDSSKSVGELYIPYKMDTNEEERNYVLTKAASGLGPNWSQAGIGGGRDGENECCTGLTIAGGKIRVLVQNQNGATAIGGGGNGDAQLSITGGDITAICSSTGSAIGGGIGWASRGGTANISITGGKIYAENMDQYTRNGISYSGVAIGSGSSKESVGSEATINIGGSSEVVAYARYGNGIGSGNSYDKTAAKATISISGNADVTTNALGGGTSKTTQGGSAEINVTDNAIVNCVKYSDIQNKWDTATENILGAFGIGGGNSAGEDKGGSAVVNVSGGTLNCNGGNIGGGDATGTGDGGDASINISDGTLDCASIGGGNSVSGMPGSVTGSTSEKAGIIVSGGTLKTGTIGGGKNQSGNVGFATAEISGGNIQGQFILSNTDQSRNCFFHMTGGTIDNTDLGTGQYLKAQQNGGAVYLTDEKGEVVISGGTIQNAVAELGGAVYMTKGSFTLSGDATIQKCTAKGNNDSGNPMTAQGGAVYLDNGTVAMTGGCILSSSAAQGGAVYLKNGTVTLSNGTIGTKTAPNTADEGAGVYVAGGELTVNGGSIMYNKAKNGAGAYLKRGSMKMSSGQILNNTASENGAGAYLAGGTLQISSGVITGNTASQDGGGVYLNSGSMTLSGGRIYGNSAVNGAGAYLNGGNLSMSDGSDFDTNKASQDGGGAYLAGGALTVDSGTFNGNTASQDGGGAYLAGGILTINGGAFDKNIAANGAGAYAADGKVRMFGGNITNNTASEDGGGFYVSSETQAADVVIRSGTISGNKAGNADAGTTQGNGGAIAVVSNNSANENQDHVVIGLRHAHSNLDMETRKFTAFKYQDNVDDDKQHTHSTCPTIKNNQATGNGGGIYMNSSASILDIYCLLEDNNKAEADSTGGSIMSVGGNVNIGDIGDDGKGNNTANAVGNILIKSKMLVKGGAVRIYGNTDNPGFSDQILVDIQQNAGSFEDYRYTQITGDVNYKIEYFENFNGSGIFTAIQYESDADIPSMGTMYVHEGYKIIGWATEADATTPTYTTESGTLIGSKNNHSAWDGKKETEALKLYAIWQRISYTVVYHANAAEFSGSMENQSFNYGETKSLSSNAYKVKGKRFANWNKSTDGTGDSYNDNYTESMMTSVDGATVDLYAQWVDCTHYGGVHDGILSYSVNDKQDTIIETCDCGNYTATLQISGANTYYDSNPHPALLTGKLLQNNPTVMYLYKSDSEDEYGSMPDGTTIPTQEGYYKACITVEGSTASVEYQIKSPASAATIEVSARKGQYFTDMNGESMCTVAQDDAFTVQYQVHALNAGANSASQKVFVTAPVLTLTQALPTGTTIIMQTDDQYWYNSQPTGTVIELASFKKMGGTEKFTYSVENDSVIADTQTYRFIIDFSQVKNNNYFANNQNVTVGLKYAYTNPSTQKIEADHAKEETAVITIGTKDDFSVSASQDKTNKITITVPSDTIDTRWEHKNLVWKISTSANDEVEALPSDGKLTLTTTEDGSTKTVISSLNQKGEFIIPFDWSASKEFTFSLAADQKSTEGKTYHLIASLYVGSQVQDTSQPQACEDNLQRASDNVSLTIRASQEPALKISSTQKVLSSRDILKVNVDYRNITLGANECSIVAVIRKKDQNGIYNESSDFGRKTITNQGEQNISLASTNGPGSYCLWVTVSKNNADGTSQTLLEVPYYFIIQE